MDGVEGQDPRPPESRPRDEAEQLIDEARPARLWKAIAIACAVAGVGYFGGGWIFRRVRAAGARGAEMTRYPGGTIAIGRDRVEVAPFSLDTERLRLLAYRACVDAGACPSPLRTGDCHNDHDGDFFECADYSRADAYCRWANKRLPTRAEYRYVLGADPPWMGPPPSSSSDLGLRCAR